MVDKHTAVFNWLAACPLLTSRPLFDFLNERQGSVGLSPTVTDKFIDGGRYMRGNGVRQYSFELRAMFAISDSTDNTNISNMQLMATWQNWIDEQNAAQNFPDFGPNCSAYRLITQDSVPAQAMRYGGQDVKANMMAEYVFSATLQYYEQLTTF